MTETHILNELARDYGLLTPQENATEQAQENGASMDDKATETPPAEQSESSKTLPSRLH